MRRVPVVGDLELPFLPIGTKNGSEATVSGVLVEFVPARPRWAPSTVVSPNTDLGFDVTVEGGRPVARHRRRVQLAVRRRVFRHAGIAIAAGDVACTATDIFAVWLPCRIEGAQHVRSVRVQIANTVIAASCRSRFTAAHRRGTDDRDGRPAHSSSGARRT
jgi:hypothetical protein